jgi:putative ABC transport system substrate-binding protein
VRRRALMTLLGSATVAWPLGALAQQKAMPAIGYLSGVSAVAPFLAAFRQALAETGYVEGQNLAIDTAGLRVIMIGCPHWPSISLAARLI